jgi:hypothetical protein
MTAHDGDFVLDVKPKSTADEVHEAEARGGHTILPGEPGPSRRA